MKIDIVMPKMGESVTEGTIIKWHKQPGDPIKKDEILFEISTDKVDTEIPSQAEGVVVQLLYKEGDTIEVGKVVAVIDTAKFSSDTDTKQFEPVVTEKPTEIIETPAIPSGNASSLVDVAMPKMGESVMEGTVIKWYKKPGETIKKDETLFEISTDKVDTEVPSPAQGVVNEILVREQETVPVGHIVARISVADVHPVAPITKAEPTTVHDIIASNALAEREKTVLVSTPASQSFSDKFYSPLVLNIARKENVTFPELDRIQGTGLNGRVTKNDILKYLDLRKSGTVVSAEQPVAARLVEKPQIIKSPSGAEVSNISGQIHRVPMDNIRTKIMKHMVNSRDTSVHVTAMVEIDMTKVRNYMDKHKDHLLKNDGIKLTYLSFIAHASVIALKEHPLVNSTIDSGSNSILQKRFINLGIAVALESNGLIVPNVKNAHEKNLLGLARSIGEIAEKSRNKKLTPDDIMGGTFTITNYGVFGTLFGTPIINQPEVAILGVGAVVKRPVVIEVDGNDMIAIKPMMYLTLSHDHRLVDGMLGGLFLKSIKDKLENFNDNLTF
ncbi:MAG: 2-oxoglutarate dehydrogenase, E2 component, dihydrolipoamide succinyltransferase [Ignavibacteriaceae bacterium]|nr:2-oxoglutarate dehydrogenase, E2 component, dihydrolipoamide succinyltransferase [Ignavibacteriaceae bacterium]